MQEAIIEILAYNNPYSYFAVENFLSPEEYRTIKESALASVRWESSPEYHDRYGIICEPRVLRNMVGKEMRNFISELLGVKVERHQGSIPQLRSTLGIKNGVDRHTDSTCGFNVGVFLHLTDWLPEMGGDLQIWSQNKNDFQLENTIQPKANTLVVLAFSKKSFHSVTPVVKDVERITLLSEWSYA